MLTRKTLKELKGDHKRLEKVEFRTMPKGLPKPLDRLKGSRLKVCGLCDIGGDYRAFFIWKTAPELEGRALYGHLYRQRPHGLEPLARMDYHLSHKNLHILINCEDERDLTGRGMPGCKELDLKGLTLDPDNEEDRSHFIAIFCNRLGIQLGRQDFLP